MGYLNCLCWRRTFVATVVVEADGIPPGIDGSDDVGCGIVTDYD